MIELPKLDKLQGPRTTQGPSNPQSKVIFGRFRQLFGDKCPKMAPSTGQWLQVRPLGPYGPGMPPRRAFCGTHFDQNGKTNLKEILRSELSHLVGRCGCGRQRAGENRLIGRGSVFLANCPRRREGLHLVAGPARGQRRTCRLHGRGGKLP